ncbi:hypothetical protein BST97_02135 [Nonlabens spongiae]|uniref:Glycosyl transferase family 1 n=1 Tax=Nonlabens spongiae TaxID=331648 RepID=A0A1W6MH22_9FLAO|nr:glycosyltransferase [Nonlabens spongiae]ARN76895.1 hypothetical protein BST97_02135 [Nonlabens spongiae]
MKIAILAHSLYPLNEPFAGGLEMITHLLVKELAARGNDVTLYAHPSTQLGVDLVPVDTETAGLSENEIQMLEEGNQSVVDIAFAKAVTHIAKSNYDVVQNHSLNCAALTYLTFLETPVVHTFHTPIIASVLGGVVGIDNPKNITFTAVSQFMKKEWEEKVSEVQVLYNGIDINQWPYEEETNEDYLFWYGRICKEKAPHHAIIAAINTDTKLLVAGPVYDREYYEMYVEPYLDNQFVEYVGHLEHDEIKVYLSRAKASLFTSLWNEPYGLVLAESLACGTPVLAYDSGASPEIIDDSCGVIVPQGQVDMLMQFIPQVVQKSRKACRERAETFCSHLKMVDSYEQLYEKVLEQNKSLQLI